MSVRIGGNSPDTATVRSFYRDLDRRRSRPRPLTGRAAALPPDPTPSRQGSSDRDQPFEGHQDRNHGQTNQSDPDEAFGECEGQQSEH